jgi:L-asparaginase
MKPLPRIAVIGCGGAISSQASDTLDVTDYPEHGSKLDVEQVLARIPESASIATLVPVRFRAAGSSSFGPAEWAELRTLIETVAADVEGVVVLHGTATLEESAYFLNLTLRVSLPVVLVGSQRPLNTVSSDAGMNLVGALRVAADERMSDLGVVVVFNDDIHSARDVVKTSNYRLQTFASPEYGPLGHLEGDGIQLNRAPARRHAPSTAVSNWTARNQLPRVDVVYSCAGTDGALIDAACAAGARGLVSIGLAPGLPTPSESAALRRALASGIQVVQTSRAHSGYVPQRRHLRESGILPGGDLTPSKCRILLMLGLAVNPQAGFLRELFATH